MLGGERYENVVSQRYTCVYILNNIVECKGNQSLIQSNHYLYTFKFKFKFNIHSLLILIG